MLYCREVLGGGGWLSLDVNILLGGGLLPPLFQPLDEYIAFVSEAFDSIDNFCNDINVTNITDIYALNANGILTLARAEYNAWAAQYVGGLTSSDDLKYNGEVCYELEPIYNQLKALEASEAFVEAKIANANADAAALVAIVINSPATSVDVKNVGEFGADFDTWCDTYEIEVNANVIVAYNGMNTGIQAAYDNYLDACDDLAEIENRLNEVDSMYSSNQVPGATVFEMFNVNNYENDPAADWKTFFNAYDALVRAYLEVNATEAEIVNGRIVSINAQSESGDLRMTQDQIDLYFIARAYVETIDTIVFVYETRFAYSEAAEGLYKNPAAVELKFIETFEAIMADLMNDCYDNHNGTILTDDVKADIEAAFEAAKAVGIPYGPGEVPGDDIGKDDPDPSVPGDDLGWGEI